MANITKPQLTRLQTLYGRFAARSLDAGASREGRLAWASEQLGRAVSSFSQLTKAEATTLIDRLQGGLGIAPTPKRRRPRREDRAAGVEGRRTEKGSVLTIPMQADLDRVQEALTRLGWSVAQYEAWLRSSRSPLARKVNGVRVVPNDITLRTLRDCNRVWWALKQMLKANGLWKD